MAKLGQDEIYQGTETFSEAFTRIPKGAAEYNRLLDKWTAKVGELNDMGDEQEGYLLRYVENIEDIVDSWEEINDYVEEVLKNLNILGKTVSDVRDMANDILKDLQGTSRTVTERLRAVRNIRSLSEDITHSLQVEGGAHQKNLERLYKKAQVQREVGEYTRKMLGTEEDLHYRIWHLTAERKKELEKANGKETPYTQELQRQIKLQEANINLIKLQEQGVYRIAEAEAKRNLEANRSVRRGTKGLGTVAKLAERAGFAGSQSMYEDYVQAQTKYASLGAEESELLSKKAGLEGKSDDASKALLLQTETRLQQIGIERAGVETRIRDLGGSQLGVSVNILKTGILNLGVLGLAAIAVKKIWTALKEVSSEAAKLQQNIGKFPYSIASANFEFASSKQYLETANELAQQFGQNPMSLFSEQGIARLAEAKNLMGYTSEQAGNLAIRAKIAGQDMNNYEESVIRGVNVGNSLNRSAVAHGVALKEVLSTSDDITLSLGNSGEKLGEAIVSAKNLGMTLKDIDNIAGQMLNFESSIENEMKAQLLTGNQLNLSRARALALQNDLDGLAKEFTKQGITAEKFANWNRIQQEATASALGMSREQLAKMLITQESLTYLTDEQVKNATGMTKEQLEAMSISERWKVAIDKLAQAFTPILEVVVKIVTPLANIISKIAGVIGKLGTVGQVIALVGIAGIAWFRRLGLAGSGAFSRIGRGAVEAARRIRNVFRTRKLSALFTPATVAAETGTAASQVKSSGLRQLGKNIAGFFKAFKTVTAKEIGTAAAAVGVLMPIAAVSPAIVLLAGAGRVSKTGLRQLGSGIAAFFRSIKTVTGRSIGIGAAVAGVMTAFATAAPGIAILATTGLIARKGLADLGKGIKRFFRQMAKIPIKGLIIGGIVMGLIATILSATALAGLGIKLMGEGLSKMDWNSILQLGLLGPLLITVGTGAMTAAPFLLAAAGALMAFSKPLKRLTRVNAGISTLASNMRLLADSVAILKTNLTGLDTKKIKELTDSAVKAQVTGGIRTIAARIFGTTSAGEITAVNSRVQRAQVAGRQIQVQEQQVSQVNTVKIENLLTSINNRLNEGYDVYLDADKVGRTLAVRTTQG